MSSAQWIIVIPRFQSSSSKSGVFQHFKADQSSAQCTVHTLSQEAGPDSGRAASKVAEQGSREKTGKGPAGWSGVVVGGCKGVEREMAGARKFKCTNEISF